MIPFLLPLYSVLFCILIVLLVVAVRQQTRRRWIPLFAVEAAAAIMAFLLAQGFDHLPGSGKAPGLTYYSEVLLSLLAAGTYAGMLFLSLLLCGILFFCRRYRQRRCGSTG